MHAIKVLSVLVVLLGIIICAGIYSNKTLSASSQKLEAHIVSIEKYSSSGDWGKAKESLSNFENDWSKTEGSWAILLDHTEMDNIDASLAKIEKYIETQDKALALGEVSTLKLFVKHIPEKESFKLKNIL